MLLKILRMFQVILPHTMSVPAAVAASHTQPYTITTDSSSATSAASVSTPHLDNNCRLPTHTQHITTASTAANSIPTQLHNLQPQQTVNNNYNAQQPVNLNNFVLGLQPASGQATLVNNNSIGQHGVGLQPEHQFIQPAPPAHTHNLAAGSGFISSQNFVQESHDSHHHSVTISAAAGTMSEAGVMSGQPFVISTQRNDQPSPMEISLNEQGKTRWLK